MSAPAAEPVFLRLDGDPAAVGRAHGAALAPRLRAFLDDSVARLGRVMDPSLAPASAAGLRPVIAAYRRSIAEQTPELAAEIDGLAEGAGLTPDEAVLLQIRREVMGYRKIPTRGDCTTYARAADTPVLAQTVDLNGDLDDQIAVLAIRERSLVLSFAGLLGYLGLNADGLAVGLNLVLGGDWRPGLPPYLAIRHLLDNASGVTEAIKIVSELRLASSRSFTLCEPGRAAYVEILGEEVRVVEAAQPAEETVHTNHFLHPDFAPHDALNVFARNSSLLRLSACTERLARLPAGADAEQHFEILSAPPVRVPDTGDIRRERTVAAVVLRPDLGELRLRPGDPALSATRIFALRQEGETT